MNARLARTLAASGLLWAGLAAADTTLDQYGTLATVVTTTCSGSCTQVTLLANVIAGTTNATVDGDVNQLSSTAGLTTTEGSGSANSVVTPGPASIPELGVSATSNAAGFSGASATAVQGYIFTGASPVTLDLNVMLTGSITNPNPDPDPVPGSFDSPINAALTAVVYLYRSGDFLFPNVPTDGPGALAMLGALAPDEQPGGATASFEYASNLDGPAPGPVSEMGTLSIDLDANDPTMNRFYVVGGLGAFAANAGRVANAADTLTFAFSSDTPGFSPDDLLPVTAVPLPAAAWLLGGALLSFAGFGRRRAG